jgi:tRNA-specific 2-thiouridylase
MGDYTKDQARQIVGGFDTGIEHKEESQEICFVPEDDYIGLIEKMCPELIREGDIVDSSGKVLGKHPGVHRYTIGQRRGLRVAMGVPYYVTCIDAENNRVTLGPKAEVMHNKLSASGVNWLIDRPTEVFTAKVKIRYNSRGASAKVYPKNNQVDIEFDEAVLAITAGQTAVIYIEDEHGWKVAGGAWIDSAEDI